MGRMLHSESKLLLKRSKDQRETTGKADPKAGQPRRGSPIRIRIQRRGPAQSRSLKAVPAPTQSVAERKAVTKTKAVNDRWNWKPFKKKTGPKNEVDNKILEAARNRLDSLTAPKVKIVHKKQREVVVMTKAPDPEVKDVRRESAKTMSKKISSDGKTKIQKSLKSNQSPPPLKVSEMSKRRVFHQKSRGRQPKRERFELKIQRKLPEKGKMANLRGRPSEERTSVNNRRSDAQARTAEIELPQSEDKSDSPGGSDKGEKLYGFGSSGFSDFEM